MNVAIITAGGVGSRFGQDVPKQFLTVDDKPIIIYTLEKFEKCKDIDAIAVVCLKGFEGMLDAYAKQYNVTKLKWIFPGGDTGMQSIQNAVFGLEGQVKDDDVIVVHDGVRPNLSTNLISTCVKKTKENGNAIAYVPNPEVPFYEVNGKMEILDREKLYRVTTPGGCVYGLLNKLHKQANEKGYTNLVSTPNLLYAFNVEQTFFIGESTNFKITTLEDMVMFKALLSVEKSAWEKE